MPSVYDRNNFSGRVNYAATVITRRGTATRCFDTCFEMADGDAVAAALIRRAQHNAKLARNLPDYLNMNSAQRAAEELTGRNLPQAAREMRARLS
jgi:hypothetical protein